MPPLPGREQDKSAAVQEIPKVLIYEEMDFQPIYYQGYEQVLTGKKTLEDIMGISSLQAKVIRLLLKYLYANVDGAGFEVYSNETGLHIAKGTNFAADIAIFRNEDTKGYEFNDNYFDIPPYVSLVIDIKADLTNIKWEVYLKNKNQKLHDWGVRRVIWILTVSQQIIIAEPNQDWVILDWTRPFTIVDTFQISLSNLLSAEH